MRHLIQHGTRTLAALAIVALPNVAIGQTPAAGAAAQPNPAAEHLSAARRSLNKVLNAPAPSGDAFKRLTELKTEYIALERAASTASPEWATHYAAIDKLVTELIGAPSASREAGAVGTSGTAGAPASRGLDPGIAANLQEFRTHLTAFSAAMSPAAPAPAVAAPAAAPAPAATTASVSAAPAAVSTPAASSDVSLVTQVDQVIALVDAALAANAQPAGATISIDRSALEQMKAQLEQIKLRMRKPNH